MNKMPTVDCISKTKALVKPDSASLLLSALKLLLKHNADKYSW